MSENDSPYAGGPAIQSYEPSLATDLADIPDFGYDSVPDQDHNPGSRNLALKWGLRGIASAAACAIGIGLPAAKGAVDALENTPVHIQVADGLSFDVTIHPGTTTTVNALGAGGSIGLPAAHYNVPFVGNVAATIDPEPVRATSETVDVVTAMVTTTSSAQSHDNPPSSPLSAIESSIKDTIEHHAEIGALHGAGEAAAIELPLAGLFGSLFVSRRRGRKQQQALQDVYASLPDGGTDEPPAAIRQPLATAIEGARPLADRRPGLTRVAGLALACALVAVPSVAGIGLHQDLQPIAASADDCGVPLNPLLADQLPKPAQNILEGATVCGSALSMGLNTGLTQLENIKTSTEDYYKQTVIPNIQKAFATWQQNPGNLAYLIDSNYVRVVQKSDLHCSFPYSQWVAPALMKGYVPDIIANTGDTMVSTGTLPFEPACISIEADAIQAAVKAMHKNIQEVAIEGNHDSAKTAELQRALTVTGVDGKTYHPITVLDDQKMTTTVDGIPFVGDMDPRASITGHPIADRKKPSVSLTHDQENQLVAKASAGVTKAACSLDSKKDIRPVELTHERTESYPAMAAGCISLALNGHYHQIFGPYAYTAPNGNTSFEYTLGSSSGVSSDEFTLYEPVRRDASTAEFFINRHTGQLAMSTMVIHPDGSVTLSDITPVTQTTVHSDAADVSTFMSTYLADRKTADAASTSAAATPASN